MNKTAAIYARVSSDQQKEQHTIASQTAALRDYAQGHEYVVPPEWVFEDEGYSGSGLVRPGLERLRDLIAEGAIETVLIYGPDRLSRNYAYQVLLLEEFARRGAEVVFLNAPAADTPEQRLLLQFQGMMAEYERAQIAERCRRGRRHLAKAGVVNVLSSVAPYGYRYVKKTERAQAYYEVVGSEAEVVRRVFHLYTVEGRSIRFIERALNAQGVATRSQKAAWRHSTLWNLLRNPAYEGRACFGKREVAPPSSRLNRRARLKGDYARRSPGKRPRPAAEWIEIAVPALVSRETFALAQERLKLNQQLSARRTKHPTLVQGLAVCAQCGYSFYRMSAHGRGARGPYRYYRCGGSDRRRPGGRICAARPVPVEQLDRLVWEQVWQLLSRPELIGAELDRRLRQSRESSPVQRRQADLTRELSRVGQQTDKLIDAYQDGLLDLAELRHRMPALRKRQAALESELEGVQQKSVEQERLIEMQVSIERFMEQLRHSAQTLDIEQKQRIVRLLVREVVVGSGSITIHHQIPLAERSDEQKGVFIDCVHDVNPAGPASTLGFLTKNPAENPAEPGRLAGRERGAGSKGLGPSGNERQSLYRYLFAGLPLAPWALDS